MLITTGVKIDGTDITDLIGFQGVAWQRTDREGKNSGLTLSGLTIRDRIATKISLEITCRPLNSTEFQSLLTLLLPEYVSVTYNDPLYGVVTKTMYTNANKASILHAKPNETYEYWDNITFTLNER